MNPQISPSLKLSETVEDWKLVYISAADTVSKTDASAAKKANGVVEKNGVANDRRPVHLLNGHSIIYVTASAATTNAADAYQAADGEVQDLPVGAGTYVKVGVFMDAAAAANDVVRVLVTDFGTEKVVT
jgi:hypothetical protein|tara:strand:+ start:1421 stop:1807 length:387 start_codon:yes stop_codon:yes gene_type:complete